MSGKKNKLFILIFLLSASLSAQHSNIFTNFKSDIKRADQLYEAKSYNSAIELYKKALHRDSNNTYVELKLANCYRLLNKSQEAEAWYEKVINSNEITPADKLYYAEALVSNGKYENAKKWFEAYAKDNSSDTRAIRKKEDLAGFSEHFNDSLSYTIKTVSINSPGSDFSPVFYKEGIVFLSPDKEGEIIKKTGSGSNDPFLNLYYSSFAKGDSLSVPQKFDKNIKTKFNEGPITIFDGGNKVIFTRNNYDKGKGATNAHGLNLMLFYAEIDSVNGAWKNAIPLPFNSTEYSISHPSFCRKTNTLYFVSDMPKGFGETDIYESKFIDGKWTSPVNLGKNINTEGKEMFPYIYRDSILFFSSNGQSGLGGLDLFYSFSKEGKFGEVKNIGYPINSNMDDFALIMSENGREGYFSSNRKFGKGEDDIYYYKLNYFRLNGIVIDKLGEKPLIQTVLKLTEKNSLKEAKVNDENGRFFFDLKPGKEYVLQTELEGYKDFKTTINTKNNSAEKNLYTKIVLERKNKSYVRCIVKDSSGQLIKDCKIRILCKNEKDQVFNSNENGEINCEVDGDAENVFIAEKDGKIGIEKLKLPKQIKGSLVLIVDLNIKYQQPYKIEGILKNEKTREPLYGYEVRVTDMITEEEFLLCSDIEGRFSFKGYAFDQYKIESTYGEKKVIFEVVKPNKDKTIEIFCPLK
jgi:hypothetical protein